MDGAERWIDAVDESVGVLIRHRDVTDDERCERAVRVRSAMSDRQQEKAVPRCCLTRLFIAAGRLERGADLSQNKIASR